MKSRKQGRAIGTVLLLVMVPGCALEEVRYKNKFGAEWRNIQARTQDDERYTFEPGLDFKWEKGVATGASFRHRSTNDGRGDDDNGVFIDISFPIWKKPKPEAKTAEHIQELQERLARLEAELAAAQTHAAAGSDGEAGIVGRGEEAVADLGTSGTSND